MIEEKLPQVVLAPMAGITDAPFRKLCRRLGAEATTSEMVSSNPALRNTEKSLRRLDHATEPGLKIVQIAGADPKMMAEAAQFNFDNGAQKIDINMGCPAKKVCNVMAGSALLKDEILVGQILEAVVSAVDVPVSVKIRTGTDPENRNGLTIAKIAEKSGVATLAVHGRTRACAYRGEAEYETIRAIKQSISIPVYANGDITSPEKARQVLDFTGADGVMIGRAAQGNPWIFGQIIRYLQGDDKQFTPSIEEIEKVMLEHLNDLYNFYGEFKGLRIARKHIRWYLDKITTDKLSPEKIITEKQTTEELKIVKNTNNNSKKIWQQISQVDSIESQLKLIVDYFETLAIKAIAA